MNSNQLFNHTYQLCQKWNLRPFSIKQKFQDFFSEVWEVILAVFKLEGRESIGLEYGDVIFTVARHGKGEPVRFLRKVFFRFFPAKIWLEKKLVVFEQRYQWWMKNYQIQSIRNYENLKKRKALIEREKFGKNKGKWVR